MTYSQGSQGYPPAQPPTQFGATTQSFAKVEEGPGNLPVYLSATVAILGVATYLASFAVSTNVAPFGGIPGVSPGVSYAIIAALIAAFLAGASLLPKQKGYGPVVAAVALVGFLLALGELIDRPSGVSIGWALILIIVFTALQALAAIGALLLDAGVIKAPAPRPKYDQSQYGQYGGPAQYYGQQGPQYGSPPHQQHAPQQHAPQQRGGYPSQYGGYPSGPPTGGFPGQSGPPTPPTGFPSFSPPQQSSPSSSAPTTQVPVQQPAEHSPSSSGPAPS
jgi:hypothetical protein